MLSGRGKAEGTRGWYSQQELGHGGYLPRVFYPLIDFGIRHP